MQRRRGRIASLPLSPVQNGGKEDLVIGRDKGKIKNAHREENILEVKTMSNCETCKGKESHAPESVPYIVHESSMARMERQVKRGWIALIVAVCLLFASNAAWLYCWTQYDYESYSYEVSADGDSDANFIGQDGNIYNGSENFGTEENP